MPAWFTSSVPTWFDWLSLVLTLIGFGVTIWQLVRTANASIATKNAVEGTERRMALNHLLVLLPQFRLIEADLDTSARMDDHDLAIRALVTYTHTASEVAGLLKSSSEIDPAIVASLEEMSRLASTTKGEIVDDTSMFVKTATKEFRSRLVDVTSQVGGLVSHFTKEAGRTNA